VTSAWQSWWCHAPQPFSLDWCRMRGSTPIGKEVMVPDHSESDPRLLQRCRWLAAAFGFGQGCCVNVYLSAGGYLGDRFEDKSFFVWMCAAVYVPPLLVFALARALDPYFDRHYGFRQVYQVRLAISMLVGAVLVALLSVATIQSQVGKKAGILALGAAVGAVAGSVASASAQFFGVISPKLVPLFFLGQTASGAYVNVAARLAGFSPDCSNASVIGYYSSAVVVAALPALIFFVNHCRGGLDPAYRRHHRLTPNASASHLSLASVRDALAAVEDIPHSWCLDEKVAVRRLAFLCQVFVVGLNISLTSLANILARNYHVGQEIVLFKLLGDFVGRVLFFLVPVPRRLGIHLALNWVVALLRLPAWIVLVRHAASKDGLLSDGALLALWFPFVVTAAFCGSWLQVIAIQAADEEEKRTAAARMNVAVYLGFLSGVLFAAIFSAFKPAQ